MTRPTVRVERAHAPRSCVVVGIAGALVLLTLLAPSAFAATDCSRPNKPAVDMILCSNDRAARADNLMAAAFRDAFNRSERRESLVQDQERWRKAVRDQCLDVPCLLRAYEDRTSELETW